MAAYEDYLAQILEVLQPYAEAGYALGEDTELMAELGLTSLQIMELIEQIEDHFDISIPLNILPDVRSVRDLAGQLHRLTRTL